jgi:guanylate kinase
LAFAAPSGTGKTTVCHELLKLSDRFIFSVSCTTRQPRPSERDGIDYHFITREQFLANIRDGKMAEWQEVFGNYYGTLKSTVDEALTAGKILLLDIEVKGTLNLQKMYRDNLISIFLLRPAKQNLTVACKTAVRTIQNRLLCGMPAFPMKWNLVSDSTFKLSMINSILLFKKF